VVIALAGNKADMDSKRKVNVEEAQQYAQDNEIIFLETSAKTALNVRNLFLEIGTYAVFVLIDLMLPLLQLELIITSSLT
jgi:Ras-related protein Rab-5C